MGGPWPGLATIKVGFQVTHVSEELAFFGGSARKEARDLPKCRLLCSVSRPILSRVPIHQGRAAIRPLRGLVEGDYCSTLLWPNPLCQSGRDCRERVFERLRVLLVCHVQLIEAAQRRCAVCVRSHILWVHRASEGETGKGLGLERDQAEEDVAGSGEEGWLWWGWGTC
jgi:hypothetical protein